MMRATISDQLRSLDPKLDRLLDRRAELVAEAEAAERARRFGASGVLEARQAVTEVEARRLAGQAVAKEKGQGRGGA